MKQTRHTGEFVAVFLRPAFQFELRKVLKNHEILDSTSWDDLQSFIDTYPVALVLADPIADGELKPERIADLLRLFPSVTIRAYVTLTAPELKSVAYLSRLGLEDVVLNGFDDCTPHFAASLSCYRSTPLIAELLASIKSQLERLPARLEQTFRDVFEKPHQYSSAIDICKAADVTIAMLYRNCEEAGLGSPKELIIAAKVLRGYGYLLNPGASIQGVAKKLGYRDARGFAEHCSRVFSQSPSSMRSQIPADDIVVRLRQWLQRIDRIPPGVRKRISKTKGMHARSLR